MKNSVQMKISKRLGQKCFSLSETRTNPLLRGRLVRVYYLFWSI